MERKQLLGAVFDEVEHHFKLYDRERKVYLGLAAAAALSLLASALMLVLRPGDHTAAIAALGAAGLVAFAAARATAFFHTIGKLVEEVVKRYSKMSEPEIVSSVETMRKRSETSLFLFACAAAAVLGSVAYSYVRTHRMERVVAAADDQAARKDTEIAQLQRRIDAVQQGYARLKDNVLAYGGYVVQDNQIIGVRASFTNVPQAPQKKNALPSAPPEYAFSLLVNSDPGTLARLQRVGYTVHLPDANGLRWEEQKFESSDAASGFRVNFRGNRCSAAVDLALEFAGGSPEVIAFNQCRALGLPEPPAPAGSPPTRSAGAARSNDVVGETAPAAASRKCGTGESELAGATESRLAQVDQALAELEGAPQSARSAQKDCTP